MNTIIEFKGEKVLFSTLLNEKTNLRNITIRETNAIAADFQRAQNDLLSKHPSTYISAGDYFRFHDLPDFNPQVLANWIQRLKETTENNISEEDLDKTRYRGSSKKVDTSSKKADTSSEKVDTKTSKRSNDATHYDTQSSVVVDTIVTQCKSDGSDTYYSSVSSWLINQTLVQWFYQKLGFKVDISKPGSFHFLSVDEIPEDESPAVLQAIQESVMSLNGETFFLGLDDDLNFHNGMISLGGHEIHVSVSKSGTLQIEGNSNISAFVQASYDHTRLACIKRNERASKDVVKRCVLYRDSAPLAYLILDESIPTENTLLIFQFNIFKLHFADGFIIMKEVVKQFQSQYHTIYARIRVVSKVMDKFVDLLEQLGCTWTDFSNTSESILSLYNNSEMTPYFSNADFIFVSWVRETDHFGVIV